MLIINRRIGEKVVIACGDHKVVMTTDSISERVVSLSFEGSKAIVINRSEIHELREGKGDGG